jgi:hypothetical protein
MAGERRQARGAGRDHAENALKHGATPVEIEVSMTADAATAPLGVSDAGQGLPAGGAGNLTEAFARGDPSPQRAGVRPGPGDRAADRRAAAGRAVLRREPARHQVRAHLPIRR